MTDIGHRVGRVRERFADVDALLVTDLTNVRWLTGFTGSSGWVVVLPNEMFLVTDGRYGEQATRQLAAAAVPCDVLVGLSAQATLDHIVRLAGRVECLGFEAQHVSYQQFVTYEAAITSTLVPTAGIVETGRRTKDPAEVALIEQACAIADAALHDVAPSIRDGLTEADVRNRLEVTMRELGAIGPSYETIVATGPVHAAMPHHRPTAARIEPGHTVIIDVGALVGGYHSDMTRSFVVGDPSPEQAEMYQVVLAAQCAGVAAVRPGLTAVELDAICRDTIADAGYGDLFTHGTGHGVGLLIHEDPFVSRTSTAALQVGDVVTVEPGVYREGFGGFRVEDLVLVTSDGCRVLTHSPKDSPCLPSPPTT